MIFPRTTGSRTIARSKLVDAAPLRIHNCARGCAWTLIQGVRDPITVRISFTYERKRRIERSLSSNVRSDAQPIRSQSVIANPGLQIGGGVGKRSARSDNRFGC